MCIRDSIPTITLILLYTCLSHLICILIYNYIIHLCLVLVNTPIIFFCFLIISLCYDYKIRELCASLHKPQHIVFVTISKDNFQTEIVFLIISIRLGALPYILPTTPCRRLSQTPPTQIISRSIFSLASSLLSASNKTFLSIFSFSKQL